MTVAAAVADFLAFETHVRGVAGSTAKLYACSLRHFAKAAGPNRPLAGSWRAPEAFLPAIGRRGCEDHARARQSLGLDMSISLMHNNMYENDINY